MQIDTDIAIIEQCIDGNWIPVAYIGPDRSDGEFEFAPDDKARVRYLTRLPVAGQRLG